MCLKVAQRVDAFGEYPFAEVQRRTALLRKQGADPIDFGVGDPTTPTPDFIREAAKKAIDDHRATGYPSFHGSLAFREAATRWVARRFGVEVDPETEVTSSIGSKEMIFHLHLGVVDPGTVVILPSPGYPPYERGTVYAGGVPWHYPVRHGRSCVPDLSTIPAEILKRTRLVWVTSPHSPTGVVAPREELARLADGCRKRGILLACDEAYSDLYYGDEPPTGALELGKEGLLSIFTLSKRSAMTGYRVGFGAGDPRAIKVLRQVKMCLDTGTPNFIQDAAVAALGDESHVEALREEYRQKREILGEALCGLGLPDCRPEAAMYIWQRVPEGMSGIDFALLLLRQDVAVVTTPGEWIASPLASGENPGGGHVRMALVPTLERTRLAAHRLQRLREAFS